MNIDEFAARLDPNNRYRDELIFSVTSSIKHGDTVLEPRDKMLFETVMNFVAQRNFPIVDRLTNTVFGTSAHGLLRTELYRYHYYAADMNRGVIDSDTSADLYTAEGHGWYISSMQRDVIIASEAYRPDAYDRDLFKMFRIERAEKFTKAYLESFVRGRRGV